MNQLAITLGIIASIAGALSVTYLKIYLSNKKLLDILLGILFFGIGMISGVYALKLDKLALVSSITSLSYLWVMIFSKYILKEKVKSKEFIGIILILIGIIFIVG
nr:hypothetical protein [Nanoarchaeum sp.]